MGKVENYVRQIRAIYPELDIDSAEINRDGQYNDVLVVNDSLIFRFAKVQDAIETLRREVAILHHLQDLISLQIPNPAFVNITSKVIGEVFVGYPMIVGIPLWRENFQKITNPAVRQRIAVQLAAFLKELHQVPVSELGIELQIEDQPAYWRDMYVQIQEKLYPSMRPDAQKEISEHFENFLVNLEQYEFKPKLRHGDFGTGNILFDSESESITGVIDFGSVGLGDPAGDFAGLLISFGETFYQYCYPFYPEMEASMERVKFYCGTFALQEALFGFDNNDQEAFRAGMKNYV
jgi:aminoglycoside 2''-phosphotransferase